MSLKLLEDHSHSQDCRSRVINLGVCLECLTVCFTTAYSKSVRCKICDRWIRIQRSVRSVERDTFTKWYQAEIRSDVDFVLDKFTRNKMNVINRLEERRQMNLPGFGK